MLGYANLHTRIAIGAMRLEIVAPSWRGIPAPPLQHLSAALDEVRLIRRRIERLSFGHRWLSLAIDVYVIETCRGRIVLAGHYHGELETALAEIVARSGCGHTDDDEVTVGFGRLLFRGGQVAAADAAQAHPGRRMRIDRPR